MMSRMTITTPGDEPVPPRRETTISMQRSAPRRGQRCLEAVLPVDHGRHRRPAAGHRKVRDDVADDPSHQPAGPTVEQDLPRGWRRGHPVAPDDQDAIAHPAQHHVVRDGDHAGEHVQQPKRLSASATSTALSAITGGVRSRPVAGSTYSSVATFASHGSSTASTMVAPCLVSGGTCDRTVHRRTPEPASRQTYE